MEKAKIGSYILPDEATIELVIRQDGSSRWAVRKNSSCLNKSGGWEYEPRPSERDDAFLERCRWDSAESAYAAWDAATE